MLYLSATPLFLHHTTRHYTTTYLQSFPLHLHVPKNLFLFASVLQCSPLACDQLNKKKHRANASIKAPGILSHRNLGRSGCGQSYSSLSAPHYKTLHYYILALLSPASICAHEPFPFASVLQCSPLACDQLITCKW